METRAYKASLLVFIAVQWYALALSQEQPNRAEVISLLSNATAQSEIDEHRIQLDSVIITSSHTDNTPILRKSNDGLIDVTMAPGETKSFIGVTINPGSRVGQFFDEKIVEKPDFMTYRRDRIYSFLIGATKVDFTLTSTADANLGKYTITVQYDWYNANGDPRGTDILTINLTIAEPPTADFTGSPTSGTAPLTVDFNDESLGSITSRSWDFGDGQGSAQQNPSHTYQNAGTYTVKLTVTGPGGSDTKTRNNYITVNPPKPTADFSGSPTSGTVPLTVQFTDKSTGSINSWSWNFGDGSTSTQQNPSHTYANPGTYTVSLTVTGPGGSNTKTQNNYITVQLPQPPTINLSTTTFQFNTAPGSRPPSQTLLITNSGGGTLNYELDDDASWLISSRIGGVIPSGESQEVNLLIFSSSLAAGTYNATITVSEPNASNSPQVASVTLIVQLPTEGAKITLTPSTFQILIPPGANAPSQTLRISNTGDTGSTLEYALDWDGSWLTPTRIGGSIPAGNSQDVTLLIRSSDLAVGNYQGKITVAAYNATNSPQTATVALTVQTVPVAPTLASPSNGAVNQPTTLALSWNPATSAAAYRLQVSTSSIFVTPVFDDSTIANTSRQVGPLANNTTYYWRVNAKNTSGTSAWSPVWSFTTILAAPLAPTLVSPANGSTGIPTNPALSWNASGAATSYRLQVSINSTFSTTMIDQSGITTTSFSVSELANNTTYFWRVNGKNAGGTSDWSSTWNFTTNIAPPSAPTLVSPSNESVNQPTTLTLTWNPAAGAATYHLQVSTSASFTTAVVDDSSLTTSSRQIGPLDTSKTYYWRVKARNDGGQSAWSSPVWSFKTPEKATGVQTKGDIPLEFSLSQNYPNPFNPSTTIEYTLPQPSHVVLKVYDVLGHEVQTLMNSKQAAGVYRVHFNSQGLPGGLYFYRLHAEEFVETKKMVITK